jgi:hypothetical protein
VNTLPEAKMNFNQTREVICNSGFRIENIGTFGESRAKAAQKLKLLAAPGFT